MGDLEYTIVSLPYKASGEQQRTAQFQLLQQQLGPLGPAARLFLIPNLKVGTLDSLLEASDELAKLDPQLEGTCFKLAGVLEDVSGSSRSAVTMLSVSAQSHDLSAEYYLKDFTWNAAQYDTKESILHLLQKLAHVVSGAEDRTRGLLTEYMEAKNRVTQAGRRNQGSLAVKPIADDVRKWCQAQHLAEPVNSEFLTTLFIAVPKSEQQDWTSHYAAFHEFVVPRSSSVVAQDSEFVLNSLVCFKKIAEDVKMACRKKKYNVRELEASDDLSAAELDALQNKLKVDKDKLTVLLKQQFTLCFVAWLHAKAIRVFVESMLRYGLPPRFVPVMLAVDEKKSDEIRSKLRQLYSDFGSKYQADGEGMIAEPGALQHDLPFVALKVSNILKGR